MAMNGGPSRHTQGGWGASGEEQRPVWGVYRCTARAGATSTADVGSEMLHLHEEGEEVSSCSDLYARAAAIRIATVAVSCTEEAAVIRIV